MIIIISMKIIVIEIIEIVIIVILVIILILIGIVTELPIFRYPFTSLSVRRFNAW